MVEKEKKPKKKSKPLKFAELFLIFLMTLIIVGMVCFCWYTHTININQNPYTACLYYCTEQITDDYHERICIESCNRLVRDIVYDISDSFDKFPFKEVIEHG